MSSYTRDPRSGGLLHALLTLAQPPRFVPVAPSRAAVRYLDVERPGIPPLCDVYLPRGPGSHPSVIVVHGGGFVIGHRAMKPVRLLATRLSGEGFAVCAIDYRLLFRGGGLDAQLDDVHAAARFWRARAAEHGCDPERISMLGLSAGAALTLLHAGTGEHRYHRLVSVYGPADFDRVTGRRATLLLSSVMGTRDRRAWKERSPATHAAIPTPLLLLHGEGDVMVPPDHARRLHALREAQGLPTELELVPGVGHGWLNDASLPQTEHALTRIVEFLSKNA